MSFNLEIAKIELQILEKKLEIINIQEEQENLLENSEYHDNFIYDGEEAVEQILKILKRDKKYYIKPKNHDKWYEIWDKNSKYNLVIENYNEKGRAYHGLITTGYPIKNYSYEANEIISGWDKYGRSHMRKQYDYRGKNIKETLEIIDIILS